jgi:hypothetical protein
MANTLPLMPTRISHDRHYCITTGWWNPMLDRVRLFAWLEASLAPGYLRRDDDLIRE